MVEILPELLVLLAAIGGVALTSFLVHKKGVDQPLVCPMGQDCSTVLHSEYAQFLGIPLVYMGLGYYGIITVSYIAYLLAPQLQGSILTFITFPLTLGAFLFSLYLTYIQAFALRQWCTWCLSSAGISSFIFLVALYSNQWTFLPLLGKIAPALSVLYLLAMALAIGSSAVDDVFFLRFLKDLRISKSESDMLRQLGQLTWLGLGITVITGALLFLAAPLQVIGSPLALGVWFLLFAIIVNDSVLDLYITPKMVHEGLEGESTPSEKNLRQHRREAQILVAISLTAWVAAFVLSVWTFIIQ